MVILGLIIRVNTMAIQWYPGHMHKARKKIKESMPLIDMVIEVLDARIPYSSENPLVDELRGERPCITLLNKSDLADPAVTRVWKQYYERERGVKAIAMVAENKGEAKNLIQKISHVAKTRLGDRNLEAKPARIMIMGIPNVGKSTLMNGLLGRVLAKVGNEPAVTKAQHSTRLTNGILLFDTPGMLWPKVEDEDTGYRLAISGAIKSTAMELEDVALYAAHYFLEQYPELIMARYKLKQLPKDDIGLLEEIGRRRGALRSGGYIDLYKASEVLINEFRSGTIGRISLETPELVTAKRTMLSAD
jgi:ribosome biogenesis GTPase A